MSVSVGIDLGTTFSAVAYIDPKTGNPQIIPNGEGKKLTPSVIQFRDGEVIFGSDAEDAFNAGEKNCVATFKRNMGSEDYYYIDDKTFTSEDLSAMLLRHLKEDAEASLGDKIEEAVITVPAYFYSNEREATIRAAETAGLKVKKIIDEPNAAAMAYGLNHWRENANILVYDLGGGTFDVTLVHMGKEGELSAITTKGNHKLGGRDWDSRLLNILVKKFEEETELSIEKGDKIYSILNGRSEAIKKQLSAGNIQNVKVTESIKGYGEATITITRAEFEESTSDLLSRTGTLCEKVLEEANFSPEDVTDILLVGGSTRMPQVSRYLEELFKKEPLKHINPDEAVALGAAIQSSKQNESYVQSSIVVDKNGNKRTGREDFIKNSHLAVKKETKVDKDFIQPRETTAHAMGVIAINDEGNRYYNEIIIPANHPRPVRAAKRFRFLTSPNSDKGPEIYVLQGDSDNPIECRIADKYVVSGIKHVNGGETIGTVIRIQYSYDLNGVIHVQARQENDNVDLPIRREKTLPSDISKYGKPVVNENKSQESKEKNMLALGSSHSLVHKYKEITFSNVEWKKYDNISFHEDGRAAGYYDEPKPTDHVIYNEKKIEFKGYNISAMNEGVRYTINSSDDFEIECDINTSTIKPHPGGYLEISLGIISAHLTHEGGDILMSGKKIATVSPRFHLKMSLTEGGTYEVSVDRKVKGSEFKSAMGGVDIIFGFVHDGHHCRIRSDASVTDISMKQSSGQIDDNPDTETWDD